MSVQSAKEHLEMLIKADTVMLQNIRNAGLENREVDNATDSMLQVTIAQLESVLRHLNEN